MRQVVGNFQTWEPTQPAADIGEEPPRPYRYPVPYVPSGLSRLQGTCPGVFGLTHFTPGHMSTPSFQSHEVCRDHFCQHQRRCLYNFPMSPDSSNIRLAFVPSVIASYCIYTFRPLPPKLRLRITVGSALLTVASTV